LVRALHERGSWPDFELHGEEGAVEGGLGSWQLLCSVSLSVHEEESRTEEGDEKREKRKEEGKGKNGKISKLGNFWKEKQKIIYEVCQKLFL
jgi:hypothetical protein